MTVFWNQVTGRNEEKRRLTIVTVSCFFYNKIIREKSNMYRYGTCSEIQDPFSIILKINRSRNHKLVFLIVPVFFFIFLSIKTFQHRALPVSLDNSASMNQYY